MKSARRTKLTKRILDAAAPAKDRFAVWDGALFGFGIIISPGGAKTFVVCYRPKQRAAPKRFMTLGPVTVDQARDKAMKVLGAVANGEDPAAALVEERTSATVAEAVEGS
jgi:Arm DNA-binding domain